MFSVRRISSNLLIASLNRRCRFVHYVQGQSPSRKIREYFYYIDHQGQLFLDDARIKNFTSCFKEKDFLDFFFTRLQINDSGRYEEFPYLSRCGRERNYIRCDDRPIVFTQILTSGDQTALPYNYAGEKHQVSFEPERVCMLPWTGRIYHPAPEKYGGIGLIKSSLAIEMSTLFDFGEAGEYAPPVHLNWQGVKYKLTNELVDKVSSEEDQKTS